MIGLRAGKLRLEVSPLFFSVVTLAFISGGDTVAMAAFLAAACHETGHIVVMAALGERPELISFTPFGIRIKRAAGTDFPLWKEALVYISGPLTNFLLAAVFITAGRARSASVNLLVGAFNLLPVGRLDGGCLLKLALERFTEVGRERALLWISLAFAGALAAAGAYLLFRRGNPTLLLTSVYLITAVILDLR